MNYDEIVEIMERHGAYFQIEGLDKEYAPVNRVWLFDEWLPRFQEYLDDLGVLPWLAQKRDCDDFALRAWGHLRDCYGRSDNVTLPPAAGMFVFYLETGEKHAIPFVVLEGSKDLVFFDRVKRNGSTNIEEALLSQRELESCVFWLA